MIGNSAVRVDPDRQSRATAGHAPGHQRLAWRSWANCASAWPNRRAAGRVAGGHQRTGQGQLGTAAAMQRTTMIVGVVILLGSCAGCTESYEERQARETERSRQFKAAQKQELADFAKRHHATPVQLLPDWSDILGSDMRGRGMTSFRAPFTAQLQERIEGSTVAFRGELVDVVRTSGDNYQLVFGNQLLGHVVAILNFDRQGAAKLMDGPPDHPFSDLLVAARIDTVEPIIFKLSPCSDPGCGDKIKLGINPSRFFGSASWPNPGFRVFGTAIAVTRCTNE